MASIPTREDECFSGRLRIARRWRGLSRRALAIQVGVTPSAAGLWEHPRGTMPSVENLARIAAATEVSFEWLATGRGEARNSGTQAPAVDLTQFAHDVEEEELLALWRSAPRRFRSVALALLAAAAKQN